MSDALIFGLGCGVTAIAFGGVYVYMRGTFQAMVEVPRDERGATILNREDVPTLRVVSRDERAAGGCRVTRVYATVVLGALVVGVVSVGVLAEARALGGLAALQVLIPAALVIAGVYVLYRGDQLDG